MGREDGFNDEGVPVAADFDQILAGVGARTGPKGSDCFIQHLFFEAQAAGQRLARGQGFSEKFASDDGGLRAAEPDEGEGGDTRRRGAGGDGVFFEGHRDEYFQKEGRFARKESR